MREVTRDLIARHGGEVLTKGEIISLVRTLRPAREVKNPENYVKYLSSGAKYLIRIFRGLYYVKDVEEVFYRTVKDIHRVVAAGLERKGLNWYYGLFTAMELGGYTHVHRPVIYVINDRVHRRIRVAGVPVRFVKVRPSLIFGFAGEPRISDPEKTVLDFLYLERYGTIPAQSVRAALDEITSYVKLDRVKLREYARRYPNFVVRKLDILG